MLAKDIMTREVYYASPHEKIETVVQIMVDHKISGMPVVDENHHVVGVVSEKDLMIQAHELRVPFYITLFDSIIFLENPLKFKEELRKHTAVKVKDVMTKKPLTVEEDTPVEEIAEIMTKKDVNRVPVVRHQKLVGIVTRNDILKSLVEHHE